MEKYAHINEQGEKQTVLQHLQGTAELSSNFAKVFGYANQGQLIGLLHDIGKYSEAFQERLKGGPKVDHSTAGAIESINAKQVIAAFCIAGHHAGLPDGGGRGDVEGASLHARLNRRQMLPDYSMWKEEIHVPELPVNQDNDIENIVFLVRMLFSCLVDADYLDTEKFMNKGTIERGYDFIADSLIQKINQYIAPWFESNKELNVARCDILRSCLQAGKKDKGLFTLTVPTGGGKTISSLAFAINHAKQHGMKRVIYVVPYTSIIEQTAEVFRKVLGSENVLEHHCNIQYEKEADTSVITLATENWDMPIIVTTAVQFFESFFSNKPSVCRKLHNCADAIIIYDEAQMIPVPYIRPCVMAISQLIRNYGCTAVLCTATQPVLGDIFREFSRDLYAYEICPKELYENPVFQRVRYEKTGKFSVDELVNRLNEQEQTLCIVNSRKVAQEIYGKLSGKNVFHLSTLLYPKHRRKVLEQIRENLKKGERCIVVSTSLVEAGVDLDFPTVFREMAGLDSILQAAGRCNREGKRSVEESVVYVFNLEVKCPAIFSLPIAASEVTMEHYDDIASKEAIRCYFNELLALKGQKELDKKRIIELIHRGDFPFQQIANAFSLIEENTRCVYIQTEENKTEIEAVRHGLATKKEYRHLQQFSINLYEYLYCDLLKQGCLEELPNGAAILIDSSLYSEEIGLTIQKETGIAIFC